MKKTQKAQTPQKSIHIIQYKHETSRIKKKSPNCYILFRKDELTNRIHKMTKVEFDNSRQPSGKQCQMMKKINIRQYMKSIVIMRVEGEFLFVFCLIVCFLKIYCFFFTNFLIQVILWYLKTYTFYLFYFRVFLNVFYN